jgi:hypothetical protein
MPVAVDVRTAEQKLVEVFLTAPAEEYRVKAGTNEMVSIEGRVDTAEGTLSSSIGIIGILGHVQHMNVTLTPAVNTTMPGCVVGYTAVIENLGNGDVDIFLNPYSLMLDWAFLFPDDNRVFLRWGGSVSVDFRVAVSPTALAGAYRNVLNISDTGSQNIFHLNVRTAVLQTYDMEIGVYSETDDIYSGEATQYITPGSSTMYDIKVTNAGNGPDTARFSLNLFKYQKPAPGGGMSEVQVEPEESEARIAGAAAAGGIKWYVSSVQSSPGAFSSEPVYWDFSETIPVDPSDEIRYQPEDNRAFATRLALSLLPRQSAWLQITIDYPADELADPVYFGAFIESAGMDYDTADNYAELVLEVKYPDLAFDETLGTNGLNIVGEHTTANSQLNIQVRIRNIGEIEARDIIVALYVDDQFLDSRSVMRLVNTTMDDTKDILISFAWKPVEGTHRIEVRLDPDNSVSELNEQNNVVNDKINIKGTGGPLPGIFDRSTCSLVFIIIVAITVIITADIIRSQRKQM